jgi:hypothetical protein
MCEVGVPDDSRATLARHFMTSDLAWCGPHTMLDQVTKMTVLQYDCGEG